MIHLVRTRGGNITLMLHVGNRYYDTGICIYMPQPYTMTRAYISSTSVFDINIHGKVRMQYSNSCEYPTNKCPW